MKELPDNCSHPDVDRWFHRDKALERPRYWGRTKLREIVMLERMLHGVARSYQEVDWKEGRRSGWHDINRSERLFNELAQQWRNETAHISSIPKIVLHPAYQKIVGMGRPALPLILNSMRKEPGYWFWALEMIARENPVPPESAGHTKQMKQAWLDWGKERGLV